MARILLADKDEASRQATSSYLSMISKHIEVIGVADAKAAIAAIEANGEFAAIISDYNAEAGNGPELYAYIKSQSIKTPFILTSIAKSESEIAELSNFSSESYSNKFLSKPLTITKIKDAFNLLSVKLEKNASTDKENFVEVKALNFFRFNKTLIDVFIKMPSKMLKIYPKEMVYSPKDVNKYLDKGINNFFISKDDYKKYGVTASDFPFLVTDLQDIKTIEDLIEVEKEGHFQNALLKVIGISAETKKICDELCAHHFKDLKKKLPELAREIERLEKRRDYINDHSIFTLYTCFEAMNAMGWGSEETNEKLTVAAILHDIYMDDPRVAHALNVAELKELDDYDPSMEKLFKEHGPMLSLKLQGTKSFDLFDVDNIIKFHHEMPDGSGHFGLTGDLPSLSCLFIVCHYYVNRLFKFNFEESAVSKIIEDMRSLFMVGNYVEVTEGLIKKLESNR